MPTAYHCCRVVLFSRAFGPGVDAFTVFWVFFITLSVFPGITGLIQPTMFSDPDLWFPIIMIVRLTACAARHHTHPAYASRLLRIVSSRFDVMLRRFAVLPRTGSTL